MWPEPPPSPPLLRSACCARHAIPPQKRLAPPARSGPCSACVPVPASLPRVLVFLRNALLQSTVSPLVSSPEASPSCLARLTSYSSSGEILLPLSDLAPPRVVPIWHLALPFLDTSSCSIESPLDAGLRSISHPPPERRSPSKRPSDSPPSPLDKDSAHVCPRERLTPCGGGEGAAAANPQLG